MRKEAGFEVTDKITVAYQTREKVAGIFERNAAEIQSEVLAQKIQTDVLDGYQKEWNINGEKVIMEVSRQA